MTTVFVAGSQQISRLPAEVGSGLETMIEKRFQILVGDANGAYGTDGWRTAAERRTRTRH
jgi:hypothetical protein